MLSPEQIETFERDGFLVLKNVVPRADLEPIQDEVRALVATIKDDQGMRVWHERALFRRRAFWKLFDWRELLEAEAQLLGDDVQLLALDVLVTRPGEGGVGWHRDVGFGCNKTLSINTAIYLQDMTSEVGPFRVVPGSHRGEGDLGQHPEDTVELVAQVGDAVLFDANLWHAGNRNRSSAYRAGLFAFFGKYWIKRMDNHFTQPLPQALLQSSDPLTRQLLGLGLRAGVPSYHGDDPSYNLRGEEGVDFVA